MSALQNPITVAAAAVAATIGLAIILVKEIVLPTHSAAVTFEAAVAKKDFAEKLEAAQSANAATESALEKEKAATIKLKSEADELKTQIKELRIILFATQQNNLFSRNDPYPFGLDRVKVGDSVETIQQVFAGSTVKSQKRQMRVEGGHDLFTDIFFTFDADSKEKVVDSIRYYISNYTRSKRGLPAVPDGWLGEALEKALGKSVMVGPDEDCRAWPLQERVAGYRVMVYHEKRDFSFSIMMAKGVPVGCQISTKQLEELKKIFPK